MAEKPFKDMNVFAQAGWTDISDADVVEEFQLDPALIGSPKINAAAFKANEINAYNAYIEEGFEDKKAREMARKDINKMKKSWRENGINIGE